MPQACRKQMRRKPDLTSSFPRAAWEYSYGALRRESRVTLKNVIHINTGRSASLIAFPRGAREREFYYEQHTRTP